MTVNWSGYLILDPGPDAARPLAEVSRAVARRFFDHLMAIRHERIAALRALLVTSNGIHLREADDAIQALNDWFLDEVEKNDQAGGPILKPEWYSVVTDIGLYLGEALISRAPHLCWVLFVGGKKDASYQRPVIMGFRGAKNPKYNVDFARLVGIYGHRRIAGEHVERDYFLRMLNSAVERA
jgi:hypothetical protein